MAAIAPANPQARTRNGDVESLRQLQSIRCAFPSIQKSAQPAGMLKPLVLPYKYLDALDRPKDTLLCVAFRQAKKLAPDILCTGKGRRCKFWPMPCHDAKAGLHGEKFECWVAFCHACEGLRWRPRRHGEKSLHSPAIAVEILL
jgi:hypothetical protein